MRRRTCSKNPGGAQSVRIPNFLCGRLSPAACQPAIITQTHRKCLALSLVPIASCSGLSFPYLLNLMQFPATMNTAVHIYSQAPMHSDGYLGINWPRASLSQSARSARCLGPNSNAGTVTAERVSSEMVCLLGYDAV
jgi:hypothetical protein